MVGLLTHRRTHTQMGLDVGEMAVRIVQLKGNGAGVQISSAAVSERRGDGADGAASVERLGRCIAECVREEPFQGRNIIVGLNPPAIEFHTLELPAAVLGKPGTNIGQMILLEVGRLLNESLEDVEARHWVLPPTSNPAPNAIAVTARHRIIAELLDACRSAGLSCRRIDAGAVALSRFGALLKAWASDQLWGVLDIGACRCRLVLSLDGVPVLVRNAGSGGNTWTERIADALQVSAAAAEVHKRDCGIGITGRGVRHGAEVAPSRELASILLGALRGELNDLAAEIKRSYEYVLGCYPNRRAADLVLVGGGAAMRNLPEFLGRALGIPVRRASDYLDGESCRVRHLSAKRYPLELLASAVGLADGT